ncbi:hypothetical protein F66182_2550 [Fusarium sp. NRRL 66182]|nr:hypothetical protein F66182_2550 [Fusarium sp. NRRL 66182]
MKFSALAAFTAVFGIAAAADQAVVINGCKTPIYVQSHPYGGGAPGALTTLKPGQRFSENLRSTGSTVKIATTRTLDKPLFFGYSFNSNTNLVHYELNNDWGNPFADKHNILNPGPGCEKFDCAPNDANCYSSKKVSRVHGCPSPVNLYTRVCA